MMTRKHFIRFAEAIRTIQDPRERERIARIVADILRADNGRFNPARFYCACGLDNQGRAEGNKEDTR